MLLETPVQVDQIGRVALQQGIDLVDVPVHGGGDGLRQRYALVADSHFHASTFSSRESSRTELRGQDTNRMIGFSITLRCAVANRSPKRFQANARSLTA